MRFTANGGGFSAFGREPCRESQQFGHLDLGSGSFLPDQAPLMLGTPSADSMVDFQNPINLLDLGNGPQTVKVTAGSGTATVDARLSGVLSGGGGLTITGGGALEVTATTLTSGRRSSPALSCD